MVSKLKRLNLNEANLQGSDLSGLNLSNAGLEGANLSDAGMEGTVLWRIDQAARHLQQNPFGQRRALRVAKPGNSS